MDLKIPIYQWVVTLIPGTLFLGALAFLLKFFGISYPAFNFDGAVALFVFLIFALVTGELIQAVSSFLEPLYYKTWGGKPSVVIFEDVNYKDEVTVLKEYFDNDDNDACFRGAMALVNRDGLGRTAYFNILYSYMRSLLTVALLLFVMSVYLSWTTHTFSFLLFTEMLVLIVLWHRAKQRGYYYVKEVMSQASLIQKIK